MLKYVLEFAKILTALLPVLVQLFRKPVEQPAPQPEPVPTPVPEPPVSAPEPPKPVKKASDYIKLAEKDEWAAKVEYAYSEWRGDRDLNFLASKPEMVSAFGFVPEQLDEDISILANLHVERNALTYRIKHCTAHPEFPDRCRIRKSVVHEFIARANELQKIYSGYGDLAAKQGVKWGNGYDSWQGFYQSPRGWTKWKESRV